MLRTTLVDLAIFIAARQHVLRKRREILETYRLFLVEQCVDSMLVGRKRYDHEEIVIVQTEIQLIDEQLKHLF